MVDRGLFIQLDSSIPNREGSKVLRNGFVPREWDVICHSSKDTQGHIGNRRFDLCVENHIETYKKAKSRVQKSVVISGIVESIRESSTTGGGFVRYDMGIERWYEVGDKAARDKVGQSLRAHNSNKKKSPEKETSHLRPSPGCGETPRVDLGPPPISSLFVSTRTTDEENRPITDNTVSVSQPSPENTSLLVDDMMPQSIHTQYRELKSNDGSDDSPSDDSLLAWFQADARGGEVKAKQPSTMMVQGYD